MNLYRLLNKNTRLLATTLLSFSVCSLIGCGSTSISEDTTEILESTAAKADSVDNETLQNILLSEFTANLTEDNVPERITIYLEGYSSDDISNAEALVAANERNLIVQITDGSSQSVLYNKTYTNTQLNNGQLALVRDNDKQYILESNCLEQSGTANYSLEIFNWNNSEKSIRDSYETTFVTSLEATKNAIEQDSKFQLREHATEGYKKAIKEWARLSTLLVSCDSMAHTYDEQEVFISTLLHQYSINHYYTSVFKREDTELNNGIDQLCADNMKTVWSEIINGQTVSLKGPDKNGCLGIYLEKESGDILLKSLNYDGTYYADTFTNVLAHDGFRLYDDYNWYKSWYYYIIEDEKLKAIAYSWGDNPDTNDIFVDIDKDGDVELITDVIYIADGGHEICVYDWKDGNVHRGCLSDLAYDDMSKLHADWHENGDYDAVSNTYTWTHHYEDGTTKDFSYNVDISKISFYEYAE